MSPTGPSVYRDYSFQGGIYRGGLSNRKIDLAKKVLIGGMTLEPAAKQEAARQLYLVIEADAVK